MSDKVIWIVILFPLSSLFTALGVFAWKRKKPMWFWSGSEVSEREITDIPAYNKANGIMWLVYSSVFWISLLLGILNLSAAGFVLAVGCVGGIPLLIIAYNRIYNRYKR